MDLSGHSLSISAAHRIFPRSTPPSPPRFQTPSISTCMHASASCLLNRRSYLLGSLHSGTTPAPLLGIPFLYLTINHLQITLSLIDDISRPYHHQHRLSRRCMSSAAANGMTRQVVPVPFLRQLPHGAFCGAFPIPRPG